MKSKRRRSRKKSAPPPPHFTAQEEAFFAAGTQLERATPAPVEQFADLDEGPPRPASWLRRLLDRVARAPMSNT